MTCCSTKKHCRYKQQKGRPSAECGRRPFVWNGCFGRFAKWQRLFGQLRFNGLGGQVGRCKQLYLRHGRRNKSSKYFHRRPYRRRRRDWRWRCRPREERGNCRLLSHRPKKSWRRDEGCRRRKALLQWGAYPLQECRGKVLSSLDVAVVFFDSRFQSVGGNAEFFGQFFDSVGTVDILRLGVDQCVTSGLLESTMPQQTGSSCWRMS